MSDDEPTKETLLLEEILKWMKFEGRRKALEIFRSELDSDLKKLMYELSDGKSSTEIFKIVKVTSQTVRDYWHRWAEAGMMELCSGYKRRYCKIFSLGELGIEIPEVEPAISEDNEEKKNE